MTEDASGERDDLAYGGVCPVCGDEFNDGYEGLEVGESYQGRICIVEKDGKGNGSMLIHIEEDDD